MKRLAYHILPFLTSIVSAIILFYFSMEYASGDIKDLLINISATLFAIPIVYSVYELIQNLTKRQLRIEIFDYAKMQIDRNVLSIAFKVMNILYPPEFKKSTENVNKLLQLNKNQIRILLREEKKIGFQILKNLEVDKDELDNFLKNPYILKNMEDNQIIQILDMLKKTINYNQILVLHNLFKESNKKSKDYIVNKGINMNVNNKKYPNRYLLLKPVKNDYFMVISFGDFSERHTNNLLTYYSISDEHIEQYVDIIYNLITSIKKWVQLTNNELIIDPLQFRMRETMIEFWSKKYL